MGQVTSTKFGANVSDKMLSNAAKCQGYSFYRFGVIKRKPTRGRGGKNNPILDLGFVFQIFLSCYNTTLTGKYSSRNPLNLAFNDPGIAGV